MAPILVPVAIDSSGFTSINLEVDKLKSYDSFSYEIPGMNDHIVVPTHVYELLIN